MMISLKLNNRDIIYDDKVKKTYNGQGIIRFKDKYLGRRAYIIYPMYRKNDGADVLLAVDRIENEGIHPDTDHTCRVLLPQKDVGKKCVVVLQDD